jgi:hypothetical protein
LGIESVRPHFGAQNIIISIYFLIFHDFSEKILALALDWLLHWHTQAEVSGNIIFQQEALQ